MRFGFWPNPRSSWPELLELCQHAESTGWDGIWYADHFMPAAADNSGPTNESWTFLSALAASVPRVRIGHLVCGNTYRHPAVVAKMAAGVDHVSGGRFVLGLGAGWQENEHRAYGIPLFELSERMGRLDEACHVVRGLLREERTTFPGKYYQLENAPLNPKPLQKKLPLMIGGGGERVTLRIVARHADEWNVWATPEVMRRKMKILDRHCAELGRDPDEIQRSAVALVDFGDAGQPKLPFPATIGPGVSEVRAAIEAFRASGVDEFIVPDFNLGAAASDRKRLMDRFREEVLG
ncbi:MAG: TIGR03560 family F420-dependent LLM class oxidoreductase [Myxococcales bacterium]|nr:TIGR03560 family F420-dependent LLM class oxidoreductase [Myxococcales bacterium]